MADPASIVGTAVGITSLGIQACQALSQYYFHFRTFDDDIGAIVKRLDGLSRTLEVLESLRPKIETPGGAVSTQLQHAVEACATGLSDLQSMAEKCGRTVVPVTAQDKRKVLKKRLLWPFKQETVATMMSTLDGLQANVQLAAQILSIEAECLTRKSVETISNAFVAQVEHLRHDQIRALATIERGLMNLHQNRFSSNVSTAIMNEPIQLCSQLKNIGRKLDTILSPHTHDEDRVYTMHRRAKLPSRCDCRSRRRIKHLWKSFASLLEIQIVRETEHSLTCESFRYGNNTLIYQVDSQFLKKLLNLQLSVEISYARTSGRYTIQPTLSIKPIVPKTSPTFSPLYTMHKKLGCMCRSEGQLYCTDCGTATNAPLELKAALNEIIRCFREGLGSPHDTLEQGRSVLDLAYDMAFCMIAAGHIDGHAAARLLAAFVDHGRFQQYSELTQMNFWIEPAMLHFANMENQEHASVLYSHRVSIASTWKDYWLTDYWSTSAFKYQILRSEANLSKYENDCILLIAMHRRSVKLLCEAIQMHHPGHCNTYGFDFELHNAWLIIAARHWPVGLRILLRSHILRDQAWLDKFSTTKHLSLIISTMVRDLTFESLDILLEVVPSGYWAAFNQVCGCMPHRWDLKMAAAFVRTMYSRIDPNEKQNPADVLDLTAEPVSPSYFHATRLCVASMQLLLDAGFAYADDPVHVVEGSTSHLGTPLWIKALRTVSKWYERLDWALLELMIRNEARLDWEHPELHTTPAHLVCLNPWPRYKHSEKLESSPTMRQILSCGFLDRCSCACSINGCLTIGCATGSLSSISNISPKGSRTNELVTAQVRTLCDVVTAEDPSRRSQMGLAVLRVLTFDDLGLSHTCCRRYVDREDAWEKGVHVLEQDPEEVEAIRYSESKDLKILENLMAELEQTWAEHTGAFLSFLKLTWLPLMQATHEKLSAPSESNVAERLGQTELYVYTSRGSDSESKTKSVAEEGERTWWQILITLGPEDLEFKADGNQTLQPSQP